MCGIINGVIGAIGGPVPGGSEWNWNIIWIGKEGFARVFYSIGEVDVQP